MRILIITSLILFLHGCSLFQTIETKEDQVTLHPNLPRPISGLQIDWNVIEYESQLYIGTSYQEYLDYLQHQQDVLRYIQQINKTVCYYRQELNENFCQDFQKEDSKE